MQFIAIGYCILPILLLYFLVELTLFHRLQVKNKISELSHVSYYEIPDFEPKYVDFSVLNISQNDKNESTNSTVRCIQEFDQLPSSLKVHYDSLTDLFLDARISYGIDIESKLIIQWLNKYQDKDECYISDLVNKISKWSVRDAVFRYIKKYYLEKILNDFEKNRLARAARHSVVLWEILESDDTDFNDDTKNTLILASVFFRDSLILNQYKYAFEPLVISLRNDLSSIPDLDVARVVKNISNTNILAIYEYLEGVNHLKSLCYIDAYDSFNWVLETRAFETLQSLSHFKRIQLAEIIYTLEKNRGASISRCRSRTGKTSKSRNLFVETANSKSSLAVPFLNSDITQFELAAPEFFNELKSYWRRHP